MCKGKTELILCCALLYSFALPVLAANRVNSINIECTGLSDHQRTCGV